MNLIMTMAGRYTRFINEGYKLPKYLLPWGNKSILSVIISELNINNDFTNIYLVANKRDEIYMPHVRKILDYLGIPIKNLFLISDTKGQAETAKNAISIIENSTGSLEGNIVFHNIDTILYKRNMRDMKNTLDLNDGYIDIFESSNHAYSYVLSDNGIVQSIAEKVLISNSASSGMYAFKNVKTFNEFYDDEVDYISDIYKNMIKSGSKIAISKRYNESDTVVLGTPSEYLTKAYLLDCM